MKYSAQNIFSNVKDSENYFIVNILTGNADILDPLEAEKFALMRSSGEADPEFAAEMAQKGFLSDIVTEKRLFDPAYNGFLDGALILDLREV